VVISLEALDLQMMLRLAVAVEAQVVSKLHIAFHLLQKALIQLWPLPSHTSLNLASSANDASLHEMKLHTCAPQSVGAAIDVPMQRLPAALVNSSVDEVNSLPDDNGSGLFAGGSVVLRQGEAWPM
jgi:hypothetical protein